jgi:hypothetical protein
VAEVGAVGAALQRELKTTLLEVAVRREECDRLRTMYAESRRDIERLQADSNRHELARARFEERTRRDVDELKTEKDRTRYVHSRALMFTKRPNIVRRAGLAHLRDLSSSLADIAAFMHEVEVQQGFVSRKNDGRGIERIRQLAYKLQRIKVDEKVSDPPHQSPAVLHNSIPGRRISVAHKYCTTSQ